MIFFLKYYTRCMKITCKIINLNSQMRVNHKIMIVVLNRMIDYIMDFDISTEICATDCGTITKIYVKATNFATTQ